ncbi:AGE family epimerase/isomerase [Terrimonas sp. NA20]|uniref:Cellobiose 2-epimerase n=1 Tax=Terrimonas ginsenosidimutans TaxID=2908004 RepID=A0ABS9KPY8_9BACT|nr:AGE family epimerase/isomerase [Terrimonas ginsenosidimutans]MCG2614388.1 AGE family epimerase/isomerase [Terrimonas ginsenosidimutans]
MHTIPADIPVDLLRKYRQQLQDELQHVLSYWTGHTLDNDNGGFYGSINWNDTPDPAAPRGIVLYSRICWTFSAAHSMTGADQYLQMATRAYEYIRANFLDAGFGGVYWSVDQNGQMLDGKKQLYGQAFCIYAMAEYFKATRNDDALQLAKDLFALIEKHGFEEEQNGYIEARSREWGLAADLRLSDKDENEKRSANTHLHIVEAYATLFSVWPDEMLKARIRNLLDIFRKRIISRDSDHLLLFFNDQWEPRSSLVSFGHDIEAAWLLPLCAEAIDDPSYIRLYQLITIPVTKAAMEGLDRSDGGLWYEYDVMNDQWIFEKHWWPQAEAMIGFFYAWQLSGGKGYLEQSIKSWEFVKSYLRDGEKEWFWGIQKDYSVIQKEKAGFWKCPYHNGRACMELITRISSLITE